MNLKSKARVLLSIFLIAELASAGNMSYAMKRGRTGAPRASKMEHYIAFKDVGPVTPEMEEERKEVLRMIRAENIDPKAEVLSDPYFHNGWLCVVDESDSVPIYAKKGRTPRYQSGCRGRKYANLFTYDLFSWSDEGRAWRRPSKTTVSSPSVVKRYNDIWSELQRRYPKACHKGDIKMKLLGDWIYLFDFSRIAGTAVCERSDYDISGLGFEWSSDRGLWYISPNEEISTTVILLMEKGIDFEVRGSAIIIKSFPPEVSADDLRKESFFWNEKTGQWTKIVPKKS